MPVPGWTAAVERKPPTTPVAGEGGQPTEVVSKITWTATAAAAVKPGQFQEFPVSLGPLPETERLVFKALQTYSDGSVVRWIEEPVDGAAEPEHPAPVLALAKEGAEAGTAAGAETSVPADDGSDGSGLALALGIAGLIAGLVGAVLGGFALVRTRRSA
jgi:periplasmic copper chaperone A